MKNIRTYQKSPQPSRKCRKIPKCTDLSCKKPRCVFSQRKPSAEKIASLQQKMEQSKFTCGDQVDVLDVFVAKESLQCADDIESMYYSGLVDGTPNAPLI